MESDILVNPQEKELLINKIRSRKFEEFQVHSHYWHNGKPRHGITLEQAKSIFEQFDKIISVYKRRKPIGYTYTFIYKLGRKKSYYLIFLLDSESFILFDAYYYSKNIEKRVYNKFFGFKPRY